MSKNTNKSIWLKDGENFYSLPVWQLIDQDILSHDSPIDLSCGFVNIGPRECTSMTRLWFNDTDDGYESQEYEYIYAVSDKFWDDRGNIYGGAPIGQIANEITATSFTSYQNKTEDSQEYVGTSRFRTRLDDWNYREQVIRPGIQFGKYDAETRYYTNQTKTYYLWELDDPDQNNFEDKREGEILWDYFKRNNYEVLGLGNYNPSTGVSMSYDKEVMLIQNEVRDYQVVFGFGNVNAFHDLYDSGSYGSHYYAHNGLNTVIHPYNFDGAYNRNIYAVEIPFPLDALNIHFEEYIRRATDRVEGPCRGMKITLKVDREFIIRYIAGFGFPFSFSTKTEFMNEDYCLPVVKEGVTTGEYLRGRDILTGDSDAKGWSNINDVDFKPHKKDGGGEDDDYPDDPWGKIEWGGTYIGSGNFTNLWYCNASDLTNLRRWMNGLDSLHPLPEGFDPMNQILGLMQFPIELGGSLTEELTMRTISNATVRSGVMLNKGFGDDLEYNLGSINIPLRMKERGIPFLDYGSTIELYVPFCGVFQLDPQTVLGADLSVQMWLSPVTGECNCIVSVGRGENRGPVAFGSGNMASDIPVTANGYGLYAAAAKEASIKRSQMVAGGIVSGLTAVNEAADVAQTATLGELVSGEAYLGGGFGAAGAGLGLAVGGIQALANTLQATHNIRAHDIGTQHMKNANGTTVSGSFSGTSAWHYPFQCYVKITRPRYKIPSNYAHTQGVPLVKAKPLGSCSGFTMCVGTDLSSLSATEIEKEQIAAFLGNGVIV